MDILSRRNYVDRVQGLATGCYANLYNSGDNDAILTTEPDIGSYDDQMQLFSTRSRLERTAMVPIYRGKVIKARTLAELRALKNYQFLLDEKADFTKW